MTCINTGSAIICMANSSRLRTADGRYAFLSVSMRGWGGVEVYRDRAETRVWESWWNDDALGDAVNAHMHKYFSAPDNADAIVIG